MINAHFFNCILTCNVSSQQLLLINMNAERNPKCFSAVNQHIARKNFAKYSATNDEYNTILCCLEDYDSPEIVALVQSAVRWMQCEVSRTRENSVLQIRRMANCLRATQVYNSVGPAGHARSIHHPDQRRSCTLEQDIFPTLWLACRLAHQECTHRGKSGQRHLLSR